MALRQCIVRGKQGRVKNADVRHPSSTVIMYRRKSASPVHNVLIRIHFVFQILEGKDALKIANYVQKLANCTSFFGHELQDVMEILSSIFKLHMQQVVWEYPAIRLNKSVIFTSSASGVVDKLLVSNLGLKQLDEVSIFRIITLFIRSITCENSPGMWLRTSGSLQ